MKDLISKLKEFIKTPLGKFALAGVILIISLFLAAMAVGIFFVPGNRGGEGAKTTQKVPVKIEQSDKATTSSEEIDSAEPDADEGEEAGESASFQVYEYKDPFQPLIRDDAAGTGTDGPATGATTPSADIADESASQSAASSGPASRGPQVLEVQDIYTENGTKYSSVKYGSTVYKVKEADQVDESPYKILAIGDESVVFLYGDRRVELKEGESVLK